MPDWSILITDNLHTDGQAILRIAAVVDDRSGITADELLKAVHGYDAVIVRSRTRLTPAVFARAARLKVVGRPGVGVDNIDLQAAVQHGVIVVNTPLATTHAVAEHTLGLMLALARGIPRLDAGMKSGEWLKKEAEGVELSGKILGILGMGNIGSAVARLAALLGMVVLGYDPYIPGETIRQRDAIPASLDEIYARSDLISLHLPLALDTTRMLDEGAFSRMKPGIRLVSTARGGVIDEAALLSALESGQVAGAALDVFAQEPPGATPLVKHPRVIATPHIAAQTIEAQRRAAVDIAEEVLAILRGKTPRWRLA